MPIFFDFPRSWSLSDTLRRLLYAEKGEFVYTSFPDGESYIQVKRDVEKKNILLNVIFTNPNEVVLPLLFLANALKRQGAKSVGLFAPYLPYMRGDKIFHKGEALTSWTFANLISGCVDYMVTVDPHLHRYHSLSEIYSIPTSVVQAAPLLKEWVEKNVSNPFLIGPDEESSQWVQAIAGESPFLVLNKVRDSKGNVTITWPEEVNVEGKTPVFVDDIISSGGTMIQAVKRLKTFTSKPPLCLVIHPVFVNDSYQKLKDLGVKAIVSCNTLPHPSNGIDLASVIAPQLKKFFALTTDKNSP